MLTRILMALFVLVFVFVIIYFASSMTMLRYWGRPPYDVWVEFEITRTRFLLYTEGILTEWNWGETGSYYENVWNYSWRRMWVTTRINLIALAIYLPASIILGILTAIKPKSLFDKTVGAVTMVFGSVPHFILMYLLVIFLGIRNNWLPFQFPGFRPSPTHDITTIILGFVIPMIALCMPAIFRLMRLVRAECIDAQQESYFLLCKTKGLSRNQAIRRHVVRNSAVTVMPELTPTFLTVLGGSFFVEMIYGIDGAARLLFNSVLTMGPAGYVPQIDIPMAMAITMFYTTFGLAFALIVDISYPFVDPRIRVGSKKTRLD